MKTLELKRNRKTLNYLRNNNRNVCQSCFYNPPCNESTCSESNGYDLFEPRQENKPHANAGIKLLPERYQVKTNFSTNHMRQTMKRDTTG